MRYAHQEVLPVEGVSLDTSGAQAGPTLLLGLLEGELCNTDADEGQEDADLR